MDIISYTGKEAHTESKSKECQRNEIERKIRKEYS